MSVGSILGVGALVAGGFGLFYLYRNRGEIGGKIWEGVTGGITDPLGDAWDNFVASFAAAFDNAQKDLDKSAKERDAWWEDMWKGIWGGPESKPDKPKPDKPKPETPWWPPVIPDFPGAAGEKGWSDAISDFFGGKNKPERKPIPKVTGWKPLPKPKPFPRRSWLDIVLGGGRSRWQPPTRSDWHPWVGIGAPQGQKSTSVYFPGKTFSSSQELVDAWNKAKQELANKKKGGSRYRPQSRYEALAYNKRKTWSTGQLRQEALKNRKKIQELKQKRGGNALRQWF